MGVMAFVLVYTGEGIPKEGAICYRMSVNLGVCVWLVYMGFVANGIGFAK